MIPCRLEEIAAAVKGRLEYRPGTAPIPVTGMVRDSREVKEGSLFLCIPGSRVDGHDYANAAFLKGAACCLIQRSIPDAQGPTILVEDVLKAAQDLAAWYRSRLTIPVVGVVGSVGKTTAKEMIAAVLSAKYRVWKTPANLNNELGVPLSLTGIDGDTEAAVIEMGISSFGEMDRLGAMVRPDICVFTVVGHAHLEFLGNLEGVRRAKSEVFRHMEPTGLAVFNGDDPMLAGFDPGIPRVLCGVGENCRIRGEDIRAEGAEAIRFTLLMDDERIPVTLHAYGMPSVPAALLAAAVGHRLGLSPEEIRAGLESYRPPEGRSYVEKLGEMTLINDCYNANPDSTAAALRSLSALPGEKIAILGDMKELGPQETRLHREIGRLTAELGIPKAVFCGPLAKAMAEGRLEADHDAATLWFPDTDTLLRELTLSRGQCAVLVKASHSMGFDRIVKKLREAKDAQ